MTETMLIAIARLMSMPKKVSAGMSTTPPPIPVIAPTSPAISETSRSRGNDTRLRRRDSIAHDAIPRIRARSTARTARDAACAPWSHPRSDPELFHLRHERRALEAETRRGAARTCDHAVRQAKSLEDALAHDVIEGLGWQAGCPGDLHAGVQGRQLQARAAREDHRSVDGVLKLADVTGPRVAHELLHHIGRNRLDAPAETSGVVRDEVAHEKRDVLGPLAQGREIDWKDVQPVVEVGAKLSRLDQLFERPVRRRDDPDVARIVWALPTPPNPCSSDPRRSFGWKSSRRAPISS